MKSTVVEWPGAPQMDTGAPMPAIHLAAGHLYVAYGTSNDGGHAVVLFRGVIQHTFGYPNDEALGGHPLYGLGLHSYAFNEVVGSPQIRELAIRNAPVSQGRHNPFESVRHWIVPFHDETLEVIGTSVSYLGSVQAESAAEAIRVHAVQQRAPADGPRAARSDRG